MCRSPLSAPVPRPALAIARTGGRSLAALLSLAIAGCAAPVAHLTGIGPTASAPPEVAPASAAGTDNAPDRAAIAAEPAGDSPGETRADASATIAGTRWELRYFDPTSPERERVYEIEFLPDGTLATEDPNDTTPGNDTWDRAGATLSFCFNGCYSSYQTVWTPGSDRLEGEARNDFFTWDWTAVRVSDGALD